MAARPCLVDMTGDIASMKSQTIWLPKQDLQGDTSWRANVGARNLIWGGSLLVGSWRGSGKGENDLNMVSTHEGNSFKERIKM